MEVILPTDFTRAIKPATLADDLCGRRSACVLDRGYSRRAARGGLALIAPQTLEVILTARDHLVGGGWVMLA